MNSLEEEKKAFEETRKKLQSERTRLGKIKLDLESFIASHPRFWKELSKDD